MIIGIILTILSCNPPENKCYSNLSDSELIQKDTLGRTLLHHDVIGNDTACLALLVEKGIDIDQRDDSGYTVLHYALKNRNYITFSKLLELGANPKIKFPDSVSVIMHAVLKGDPQMVEPLYLVRNNKYSIVTGNENYCLGIEAIRRKNYSMAELIIWPMHYIVKRDKPEYFDHLILADKSLIKSRDEKGMTPLHIACLFRNEKFIELLRSAGTKDTIDIYGKKPWDYQPENFLGVTEVNTLDERMRANLDDKMLDFLMHHDWLTLGVIKDGKVAYLRSYGNANMIDRDAVHASVSKPMTSVIFMQLLKCGMIRSLDDPVSDYSKKYRDVMPQAYVGDQITFRHILTHTSGIPHINKQLWINNRLNLLFKPGTQFEYSTNAFSILGEVLEEITEKSFSDLVKEYIGQPIGATSFWAEDVFRAPAARIHSTPRDFVKFAEGIINNTYISGNYFDSLLIGKSPDKSLGWGSFNNGTIDLTIGHSGSNGKPRSHILIKPKKKNAILLMGQAKDAKSEIWFLHLAPILMDIIEDKGYY